MDQPTPKNGRALRADEAKGSRDSSHALNTASQRKSWVVNILPGGIRARLVALIALALLPLLILLAWISYQRYETRRFQAMETELEVARGIAMTFSSFVDGIHHQNHAVGQAIAVLPPGSDEETGYLLTLMAEQSLAVRNVNWVSPQGIVLASSEPDLVGRNLAVRPYFEQVLSGRHWAIGDLTANGVVTNSPTLAIATGVRDEDGVLSGVVVTGIEPARLGELTLTQERPSGGLFSIFDREGRLVYTNSVSPNTWEERANWVEGDPLLRQVLDSRHERAGITQLPYRGGGGAGARVPVGNIGFVAGAHRTVDAAIAPVRRSLVRDALIALAVWLLAFLLASLLAQTIAYPLHRLEQDAEVMGTGRLVTFNDPQAPTEVSRLRETVEKMASALIYRADALQESEERFRVLFHNRHSPMLLIDPATAQIIDANPAASLFYGWPREELAAMKITDINTLPLDQTQQEMGRAKTTNSSVRFHFRHRLASGEIRDVEVNSGPIQIGEKEYLFSIIHDITEREQMQKALHEAHQHVTLMARLPEENPNPVARVSGEGVVLYHNLPAASLPGWTCQTGEMLTEPLLPIIRQAMTSECKVEQDVRLGERIYSVSMLAFHSENYVNLYGRDITESRRAEEALRQSENRLRRLVEANIIGIVTRDVEGHIKDANDAFLNITGYTCDEMKAGKLDLKELVPEEYGQVEKKVIEEVLSRGSGTPIEKEYIRKDGSRVPVMVGYTRLEGSSSDFIGFVLDLSELKRAQSALAEYAEKLKRSNRELEQFAFVASHDLQEPLRKIRMFGGRLRDALGDDLGEEAQDYLERIQSASERMAVMINGLLELARVNTRGGNFAPADLTVVAEEAVSDLVTRVQAVNGQVQVDPLPAIQADALQIRQLFQNLIGNSLKFHREGVAPVIRISGKIIHMKKCAYARIIVEDNGIGFEQEHAERIFQPFQRLHGRTEYEGTGLGLAICQKIVERHQGKIEVRSKPGEGSVFTITLPVEQDGSVEPTGNQA